MNITDKRRLFHVLLASLHMMQAKEHLLEAYNVSSTLDLSEQQLDELIAYLKGLQTGKPENVSEDVKTWRHKCLRVMSDIINTQDWQAVNKFMMDKRIAGKHLYELNLDELKKLQHKLFNIRDIYKKKDDIIKYKAALN